MYEWGWRYSKGSPVWDCLLCSNDCNLEATFGAMSRALVNISACCRLYKKKKRVERLDFLFLRRPCFIVSCLYRNPVQVAAKTICLRI